MEFKSFYETYRKISFALSVGMMYPNPNNEKRRLIAMSMWHCIHQVHLKALNGYPWNINVNKENYFTVFIIGTITPILSLAVIDIYRCYLEKDFVNIVRHSTVVGPFLLAFFKVRFIYHFHFFQVSCTYLFISREINA